MFGKEIVLFSFARKTTKIVYFICLLVYFFVAVFYVYFLFFMERGLFSEKKNVIGHLKVFFQA